MVYKLDDVSELKYAKMAQFCSRYFDGSTDWSQTERLIIGIDPGEDTGFVVVGEHSDGHYEILWAAELKLIPLDFAMWFEHFLRQWHVYIGEVVYETFISHNHEFFVDANPPIKIIAYVEWLTMLEVITRVGCTPGSRDQVDENALKGTDLWIRGGDGHARQALRHVLAQAIRDGNLAVTNQVYPRD